MPADPRQPPAMRHEQRLANRLSDHDRQQRSTTSLFNGGSSAQIPVVATLPSAGRIGRVLARSDGTVWFDNGSSWKQFTLT